MNKMETLVHLAASQVHRTPDAYEINLIDTEGDVAVLRMSTRDYHALLEQMIAADKDRKQDVEMDQKRLLSIISGQSAVIAAALRLLVENGSLSQQTIDVELAKLLVRSGRENPDSAAPIRHITDILRCDLGPRSMEN